jgi:aminomethyltransferase
LEEGGQMLAAFPDAKGRLIAVVRVLRQGERYLFETEAATREAVYQNLFRFTFAGNFFVEDLSDSFLYFEIFGPREDVYHPEVGERFAGGIAFELPYGAGYFIPNDLAGDFHDFLTMKEQNDCQQVDDELYETLRIESGIPKYGVDMDETTVVPELGLDGLVSYNKGCYIGQEIIARIHFRGHVAKQLTGLLLSSAPYEGGVAEGRGGSLVGSELASADGKPAGKITSVTYSPQLKKTISLAYARYDYLAPGTELLACDMKAVVTALPFIK